MFVTLPLIPSFFSFGPIIIPGVSASTTNPLIPLSVLAKTKKTFAKPAFVIQTLLPFKIHLSCLSSALVDKLKVSEPAPGSVKVKAAIFSPDVSGGRYFFLSFQILQYKLRLFQLIDMHQ